MDEALCPPLHRFLSFCRILMLFHPRVGARNYSQHLFGNTDLKPGWNAIHSPPGAAVAVRYIKIAPEGGLNTTTKPNVPDAEIHDVYEKDLPPYDTSLARQHLVMLAGMTAARQVEGYGAETLQQIITAIDTAGREPLRGPSPAADARIARALAGLKQAIDAGGRAQRLAEPLREVIRDGLAFRLSMSQASSILGYLIARCLQLRPPPFLDKGPPRPLTELISDAVDRLIDRALTLKDECQKLKLTPFYDATYLAILFGNTALGLCQQAASQCPAGSPPRRSFERRGLYIDETMAHDLQPCLMHPVDLAPFVPPEYQHAAQWGIVDAGGIYAGAGDQGKGPVDVPAMWPRIEAYAASAADRDIAASLDGDNDPLDAKIYERLQMFLLTMQLGRGG